VVENKVADVDMESLGYQLSRLNSLLDVMVHLFPESSEGFEYEQEILAILIAAQELSRSISDQFVSSR
jgi:hypothetical protein